MQVQDNLEVFFCDLCNTSVPQRDLETGDLRKVGVNCYTEEEEAPRRADQRLKNFWRDLKVSFL